MVKSNKRLAVKKPKLTWGAVLPEDFRCSCGRNLHYPQSEDESTMMCRCGKRYTKPSNKRE
jgi:hypothetical protein